MNEEEQVTPKGGEPTPLPVLIVEDEQKDYETVIEALEGLGRPYDPRWARDYDEAREYLIGEYFSLIVLDLVLDRAHVANPEQWGGLLLLWDIRNFGIQGSRAVVVNTSHPDIEISRRATKRYEVADFLAKRSARALAGALRDFCEERSYFGLDCGVEFAKDLSWPALVEACTRRQDLALTARMSRELAVAELEGLFRLAFRDCASIAIRPMALGYSGTGLVRVERTLSDGSRPSDTVAKFGDVETIRRELDGWEAISEYFGANHTTQVLESHMGLGLGLLTYRFIGTDEEQLRPFPEYYADAGAGEIGKALHELFVGTCGLWYREENRQAAEGVRIDAVCADAFGVRVPRLLDGYEFRFGEPCRDDDVVSYPELDRQLPHMVQAIKTGQLAYSTNTWRCRTHGDLHGENVLVNPGAGECWLVDFGRSGIGHWAQDLAQLETFIRFRLAGSSDLGELYEFENLLASVSELGDEVDASGLPDPGLRKAATVISQLRLAAAELVDPYPRDRALAEYMLALVYAGAKYFEFHRLLDKRWRKHHVLIASGVTIERLQQSFVPAGLLGVPVPPESGRG